MLRVVLPLACGLLFIVPATAQRGTTTRVSVSSTGEQANYHCNFPSVSNDGRFVAFYSIATSLVPGDKNRSADVFVHDRAVGQTERVSASSTGQQGNDHSYAGSLSSDGRFVAFGSGASNLVLGDTNGWADAFVRDRATGQTIRVSISSKGQEGNASSSYATISADGRFAGFWSWAKNFVPDDTNAAPDIFVHDRTTGQTTRVSVSSTGQQANDGSSNQSLSADGRFVAFHSHATNLVLGDTNGHVDIFVHDRATGQTTRVSVSSTGEQGNDHSWYPSISGDGRFVAFQSDSNNLGAGQTRGQVFVHDRLTRQTTVVSVSSAGQPGYRESAFPSISAEGRFVAFESYARLVPGDTNSLADAYVHDRATAQTTRVSVSSQGYGGEFDSFLPSISADGRFVAFESRSRLVPGDTNGYADVFVHQYGPDFVRVEPQSFSLFRGVLVSGTLSDLLESDDSRMVLRPGVVLSTVEAPIQLLLEATAPAGAVAELRFRLEAHANIPNIGQRIALFDFAANGWSELDSRLAATSDSVVEVYVVEDPARFVEPGTNALRARVAYKEAGPVFSYPWFARIDQTIWLIAQ